MGGEGGGLGSSRGEGQRPTGGSSLGPHTLVTEAPGLSWQLHRPHWDTWSTREHSLKDRAPGQQAFTRTDRVATHRARHLLGTPSRQPHSHGGAAA